MSCEVEVGRGRNLGPIFSPHSNQLTPPLVLRAAERRNMSVKFSLTCAVVFAVGTLLFSGNAFGQFGGQVKVSNAIEGGGLGVSAARCGSGLVVGFADT